jgi:type VI secretion system secreted protein Hcp
MDRLRASAKTLVLIAVAILVGAGTYAVASIPGSDGVITACWDHNNDTSHFGTLRVIDPSIPASGHSSYEYSCLTDETQITWNQQGPAGPTGPAGPQGALGPRGPVAPSTVLPFRARGSALFLAIDGIKGESTDKGHKGEIELRSFSFGTTGGGTSAKVHVGDLVIVKTVDKSSPKLFQAAATGKHFPTATISLAKKSKGKKVDYLKFTMKDLIVTSIKPTSPQSDKPSEQVSMSFAKINVTYVGQSAG